MLHVHSFISDIVYSQQVKVLLGNSLNNKIVTSYPTQFSRILLEKLIVS